MSDETVTLVGLFVEAGLAGSNGEVRRHMKAGAAKVNDAALSDPFARPTDDLVIDGAIKLSVGKKRHALAKPA
jgi:tyrosyl-tRNA synthetase